MKTLRALLVLTSVIATACGDDGEPLTKGRVDVVALANSATVTLSGATGSITVPFATPVPNVPNDDLEEELSGAVALTVSSPRTQVSFNLMDGVLADLPAAPGEYSWVLNAARDQATLTFFNSTTTGFTLKQGLAYDALLSVGPNDYVQQVTQTSFSVAVQ